MQGVFTSFYAFLCCVSLHYFRQENRKHYVETLSIQSRYSVFSSKLSFLGISSVLGDAVRWDVRLDMWTASLRSPQMAS